MSNKLQAIAAEIERCHRDKETFGKLAGDFELTSIKEAYAAQNELQKLRATGSRGTVAGRKIALASKVQQELCGIDHPIAGAIYSNEIYPTPATLPLANFHGLGIEYEIAITLGQDTDPTRQYTEDQVRGMIKTVHPAFEMIIDRGADYTQIDPMTMIADNAWCAGIVLGQDILSQREDKAIDALPVTLYWNDDVETATTAASNPIGSLTWVINLLCEMGESLLAGQPVITGSVLKTRYPVGSETIKFQIDGYPAVELNIT